MSVAPDIEIDRVVLLEIAANAIESSGLDRKTGGAIQAFLLTTSLVARGAARCCGVPDALRGGGVDTASSGPPLRFYVEWVNKTGDLCRARGIQPWRVTLIALI